MDPTDVQAAVERLAEMIADQEKPPTDRAGWIAAALVLRGALDEIREAVDNLDVDLARRLADEGVVTKRCAAPGCWRWMVVAPRGRRRRTCSAACRVALARAR